MNILIIIDSLGSGGAQRQKTQLAYGLAKKFYDVSIFTYHKTENFFDHTLKSSNINFISSENTSKGFSLKILLEIRNLIKKNNYDLVISSMHSPSIYAALAILGIKGPKLIICEESSSIAPIRLHIRILFYLASLLAYKIVTNSYSEKELLKKLPGRSKKINVVWNGFNISEFMPFREIKSSKNLKKILVIGRVAYPKTGLNLLKGFKVFYDRNGFLPEINWIGRQDNDKRSVNMRNQMEIFLEKNLPIKEKFFFRGQVKDINEYFQTSNLLIHPSIYEGLPMVICEAMFEGLFVIASDVCDHPKMVPNKERGLLFNPLDPNSISDSLEIYSSLDERTKDSIVVNARKFAMENFSLDKMIEGYERLF